MIEEELLARKCFKRRKFILPTVLSDEDWQNLMLSFLNDDEQDAPHRH